jgi:hypothetical protein
LRIPSFFRLRQRAAASFSACDSAAKGALKPLAFLPLLFVFLLYESFLVLSGDVWPSKSIPSCSALAHIAARCASYMTSAGDSRRGLMRGARAGGARSAVAAAASAVAGSHRMSGLVAPVRGHASGFPRKAGVPGAMHDTCVTGTRAVAG